jgi:hypothetical protein
MKYTTFKLGEIFIKSGAMTEEALDRALKEQKGSGKRIDRPGKTGRRRSLRFRRCCGEGFSRRRRQAA